MDMRFCGDMGASKSLFTSHMKSSILRVWSSPTDLSIGDLGAYLRELVEIGKGSEVVCTNGFMMKYPMRAVNLIKGIDCDNCL